MARLLPAAATTVVVVVPTRRLMDGEPATAVAADQPQLIERAFNVVTAGAREFGTEIARNSEPPG